ncbi:MAG: endo-1,3-alpha-glucanase family glycosylhydrolase [Nakamurella sp.]
MAAQTSTSPPPSAVGQVVEGSSIVPGEPRVGVDAVPAGPVEPPVLAHYYMWFTPNSWNRAKSDIPLAGRYSSDDSDIMREQITQAKRSGIDGFIVSWKSTEVLNARLATLVAAAAAEDFKLEITYQGLDFNRNTLPGPRIAADLQEFADLYGKNPVFDLFGKPFVVLTGTPAMTRDQVMEISAPVRDRLLVLASDKDVASYESIADLVDGDLYYWSSVNPETNTRYATKLSEFGASVRSHGGIWIAPVSPGFDARLVGGKTVVDRRGGQTFRDEWAGAVASEPDAIGIISWNEFSENTHIEPSQLYGSQSLDIVAGFTGAAGAGSDVDSSASPGQGSGWSSVVALAGVTMLFLGCGWILIRRSRRARS